MARVNQPCAKDCPDRKAGCHASCERWAAYEKERNEEYKKRLLETVVKAYRHDRKIKHDHLERHKRGRK